MIELEIFLELEFNLDSEGLDPDSLDPDGGGYNCTFIPLLRHLPRGGPGRRGCRGRRGRPLLHQLIYTGTPGVEEGAE